MLKIGKKFFSESSKVYPLFFTLLFIFILLQYSFTTLDAIFYDLWARFDFGIKKSNDLAVIYLDEESDEFLGDGQPYTYATHLRFIEKLLESRPAVINYFVELSSPDSEIERENQAKFKALLDDYIARGGVFRFASSIDSWGEQLPPQELRSLGYSLGIINVDNISFARDDVCRRAILNISGDDSIHLWTANVIRKRRGEIPLDPGQIKGSYYSREADALFSMFRYPFSTVEDTKNVLSIPYHRIVVGNYERNLLRDKIVLVGTKYISNASDYVLTPFNKEKYLSPKINVHAAIIDSLSNNETVISIPNIVMSILSILIALMLSYVISRMRPTTGLTVTVSTIVAVLMMAYLMFVLFGLWFNLTHVILSIFVVYYIWVPFRAIGEYQRRYAIEEEAKLFKEVDALKQNFISFMSHDLKTPVAKIAGIADILKNQHQNTSDQMKLLSSIIDATKELNKFITSILDLTKVESKNLNLEKVPKDLNKIVESVVESLKFEASEYGVRISTSLAPLYPIHIDPNLIHRVVSNLVENALKYGGKNSTVEVKTWDDNNWVYLMVSDNGIGIAESDLPHLFNKFFRVKNDQTHRIKGTGLGLYLVKYFVELHEGSIEVESKPGEGTKFSIKLRNS